MIHSATPEFLARLEAALPAGTLRERRPGELEDPRGRYQGQAATIACPATVEVRRFPSGMVESTASKAF